MSANNFHISPARFNRFKSAFWRTVNALPGVVTITITPTLTGEAYTTITGDSNRVGEQTRDVNCFYVRSFDDYKRSKFGLEQESQCVLYIPPDNLIRVFGTHLDIAIERCTVFGIEYAPIKVRHLAPFYNTCLAVEIQLKTIERV